jgi:hypothetical protein
MKILGIKNYAAGKGLREEEEKVDTSLTTFTSTSTSFTGGDGGGYSKALQALVYNLDDISRVTMVQQMSTGKPDSGGHCVWCTSLGSPRTHGNTCG